MLLNILLQQLKKPALCFTVILRLFVGIIPFNLGKRVFKFIVFKFGFHHQEGISNVMYFILDRLRIFFFTLVSLSDYVSMLCHFWERITVEKTSALRVKAYVFGVLSQVYKGNEKSVLFAAGACSPLSNCSAIKKKLAIMMEVPDNTEYSNWWIIVFPAGTPQRCKSVRFTHFFATIGSNGTNNLNYKR